MTPEQVALFAKQNKKRWPVISRLYQIDPTKQPINTAVNTLSDPEDIRGFVQEYGEMLEHVHGGEVGIQVSKMNIGYILGYYSNDTRKLWYDSEPSIGHPIFGRQVDIDPLTAFGAGVGLANESKRDRTGRPS